jgi:hypothetical protein
MRREDYDEAGWGKVLCDRWDRLQKLVDDGTLEQHPLIDSWNDHSKLLRDARRAKDAAGSGLGARELEENDQPGAQDDPPPTPGTPVPERSGATLAAHDAAMRAAIPGLDRLRGPYSHHDTRVVDEDGIVQPRGRR